MKYLSTAEQTASFSSRTTSIQNKQWRMKIKQVPNQTIFRNSSLHTRSNRGWRPRTQQLLLYPARLHHRPLPRLSDGLGFEYNSVTGAVGRNFD